VDRLDASLLKQLPDECAAFGPVIVKGDECVTM
jgi:hypothetical protein